MTCFFQPSYMNPGLKILDWGRSLAVPFGIVSKELLCSADMFAKFLLSIFQSSPKWRKTGSANLQKKLPMQRSGWLWLCDIPNTISSEQFCHVTQLDFVPHLIAAPVR